MIQGSLKLLNIGFKNSVAEGRVVAIISAESSPMRRLKEEAKRAGRLVDGTNGRKTRSVLVTDSNHIILSSIEPETLLTRVGGVPDAG